MPLLPELEPVTNPFGVPDGAKPPGMIVTRDEHSPPRSDGGRPWADTFGNEGLAKPGLTDTLGASFRLENEIVGAWRKASEADLDFGPEDPTHNPWDYKLKDNPRLRGHAEHFVSSRNAKETDYIASRIERELEDRRIRDVSGVTGFATDMVASLLSPTILLPGGTIYRGYRAGYSTLRSAGSVAAYATLGVSAQEAILQSQQYTRTIMESLLNVGGGTILGGMLGGGVSHFSSRALRKASQAFDTHLDGIRADRITIDGVRDPNEAPFGSPVGAAPVRELQENRVAGAFGLERLFSFQSPLSRVMAGTSRVGRDIMTRLAEMPFMTEQNKRGIATGPTGGTVESRIKVDGDITIYRVQNAIYDNFNAYRFGNKDATLGPLRAGFADVTKPDPGRLSQKRFKEEITRALRSQTKEQGIEHPIPEVKAAAVAIRKEFDTWLERAIDVGILPAEAKYSLNYVMRRWDVGAILDNMARLENILFDHLKGGQRAAEAELKKLEDTIASLRAAGDLGPEVEALVRQRDELVKRFAVDRGTVDTVMDMWRFVVKEKPKKPLSLSEMLRKEGGIRDDGRTLEHLLGSKKQAGSLINSKSKMDLDGAGLVAFEKGYFDERPTVRDLLDAIDEDVRSGGTSHFSRADADAVENWRVAGEFKEELERYGIAGVTSEKQARKIVTQMMREESATPAAQAAREGIDADRAFLDDITKADIPDTPEARAALDDAKLETETRIDDAEQSLKRMGDDGEEPLFAGAAPARMVRRMVETGQTYRLSENDIARQFDAVAEFTPILPGTTALAVWSRVGPSPTRGPGFANVAFRTSDGREVSGDWSINDVFNTRAAYIGGWDVILAGGIGKEHRGLAHAVIASGVYHEIVHAFWRNLATIDRVRLAAHADKLRVLDMELGTFLQAIGHPSARNAPAGATIRSYYQGMYGRRKNILDLIDQEAVAHMQELHYAGHFSDAEVEAVLPDLLNMRGGAPARANGDLTPTDMPLFAVKAGDGDEPAESLLSRLRDHLISWRKSYVPDDKLAVYQSAKSEAEFMATRFVESDGASIATDAAYENYRAWAQAAGEQPKSPSEFLMGMMDQGYRMSRIAGRERFLGVDWTPEAKFSGMEDLSRHLDQSIRKPSTGRDLKAANDAEASDPIGYAIARARQDGLLDETFDGPLFAVKAGDEPEAPRIPPELIEQARALAERMGVRVPDDLATLDIDDGLKSLGDMLEAMVGRGEASSKANAADIQKLVDQKGEADFLAHASDGDLRGIVRDTISKLTGSPIARNVTPFDLSFAQQGPRGPAMARTLKIADNLVEDFLDSDIERIMLAYVRTMAPDVAIAREFGDLNLTEDKQRLLTEYQSQVATASPKDARRLHKEHLAAIRDIDDVTRRLRGTFNDGVDPTSFGPRAAMFVKQANILRLMGSVVASSISDPMKLLFMHGFRGNADLFSTLVTDFQGLRMSKAEAKEMSAGLEFSHSRTGQMWDTIEEMAGFTAPERAMRYMTNKMGRLNLMDAWNSTLKQLSGAMTTNRILRASLDYTNGRIAVGNKDVTRLAASGIDADLARVIAQQYQKHGTVHGRLFLANVEAWDDTAEATMAKHALQSAVRREADITIVTPGQEKPTWTSRHMGSVIGQFRTFQLVSIQRTLIAGLQEVDAAKIVALTGMIGLGMLSEQLKSIIHGKDPRPKDMGEWLYAGLANSGALGWMTDADQALHKLSGGNVSVARRVFGNDRPISRFASQNITGSLAGPTWGAAEDIARAASAGLSGKGVTEGDIHAMRRLIPYQNLFYISRSLRAFEEGLIDAWGIPRQRARN